MFSETPSTLALCCVSIVTHSNPDEDDSGTEVSGIGYARQAQLLAHNSNGSGDVNQGKGKALL